VEDDDEVAGVEEDAGDEATALAGDEAAALAAAGGT